MNDILTQLANYLVANNHWPRMFLLLIGAGLLLAGLSMWLNTRQKKEREKPERRYRRGQEIRLNEMADWPREQE